MKDLALEWATWCGLGALFLGIGRGLTRALRATAGIDGLTTFWCGWAASLCALQVLHLVLPIGAACLAALAAVGATMLVRDRHWCLDGLRRHLPELGVLAVAALWLGERGLGAPQNGDSLVYHLQAVAWAHAYPAVPGLAHLHPFLGVGHGFFLYAALLEVGPLVGRSQHVANGLLCLAFLAQGLRGLRRAGGAAPRRHLGAMDAVFLVPAMMAACGTNVTSPSSDVAELALGAALVTAWAQWVDSAQRPSPLALVPMATGLLVVKLSSLGAGLAIGGLITVWLLRTHDVRALKWLALLAGAPLLAWSTASVVRTGYVAYPSPWPSLPVPWRLDPRIPEALVRYTIAYSRGTLAQWDQPATLAWVGPWALRLATSIPFVLEPLLLSALLGIAAALALGGGWRPTAGWGWKLLPVGAQLAYWLCTAPDDRYAGPWLWALAAVGVGIAARTVSLVQLVCVAMCALAAGVLADGLGLSHAQAFVPPPAVPTKTVTTQRGVTVTVPEGRSCSATPLPCTPFPDPFLAARQPGLLGKGFLLQPPVGTPYTPWGLRVFPPPTR